MRLIDAKKLGLTDFEIFMCDGDYKQALKLLLSKIDNAPTVDAVPVRHGKWLHPEEEDEDYGSVSCSCSVCGWKFYLYEDDIDGAPYCPTCGAKMEPVSPLYQKAEP